MSKKNWKEVIILKFTGRRFDDHSLEISVLNELINYQNLINQTAKELWYKRNSNQKRLPKNFEDNFKFKFDKIYPGSTEIHLSTVVLDSQKIFNSNSLVEEPINIINNTIIALNDNKSLPKDLPKAVIPGIVNIGKSLNTGEEFFFVNQNGKNIKFSDVERDRLKEYIEQSYEDNVTIVGEIKRVDFSKSKFEFDLFTKDNTKVTVVFDENHDELVADALRYRKQKQLKVTGCAEFKADGSIKKIFHVDKLEMLENDDEQFDPNQKPIWEIFIEGYKDIPEEELKKLPKDGSINLDKYLYGI